MAAWSISLTALGVVLQLGGLVLGGLEVRARVRHLAKFQSDLRNVVVFAEPIRVRVRAHAGGVATHPEPPSLEERLARLEHRWADELAQRLEDLRKEAVTESETRLRDALKANNSRWQQDIDRIRDLLVGTVSGNRRAYLSLGLLMLGLFAQAVGSILGIIAQ